MITKTYAQALREFQVLLLSNALVETRGNASKASRALGIHRNSFSRILEEAGTSAAKVCRQLKEDGLIASRKQPRIQKPQLRWRRAA